MPKLSLYTSAGLALAATAASLVKVSSIFQGTVTFTPDGKTTQLMVECWGAGGGGGGCATAITNAAVGGGGGGGAYSCTWSTVNVQGAHTIAVGAGGNGGAAGANNGAAGGDTDFKDAAGTSICTAKGGSGGTADTVSSAHTGPLGGNGGASASGVGDIKVDGHPGYPGITITAAQASSGMGGDGVFAGGGAQPIRNTQSAGNNALNYGAGGSGGCIISGGASVAGGNGSNGLMRVWEFA